jgi:hypothetical protein
MWRVEVFGTSYFFDTDELANPFAKSVSLPGQAVRYDMTAKKEHMTPHEQSGGWVYSH